MKKQKGDKRQLAIFLTILAVVILVFLASYLNALDDIRSNCQAPTPHFNDLISIFEIPLDDSTSPTEYNSQSCLNQLQNTDKEVKAKDCYIKNIQFKDNSTTIITCHCWHK